MSWYAGILRTIGLILIVVRITLALLGMMGRAVGPDATDGREQLKAGTWVPMAALWLLPKEPSPTSPGVRPQAAGALFVSKSGAGFAVAITTSSRSAPNSVPLLSRHRREAVASGAGLPSKPYDVAAAAVAATALAELASVSLRY